MHHLIQNVTAIILIVLIGITSIQADVHELNGIYRNRNNEDGRYYPTGEGQYFPTNDGQYHHVDDMRELGKYVHIPYPYDGGYGPYDGTNIPYIHDGSGSYYEGDYNPTTKRPKRTYYDEGGWRIIRQEEKKQEKKYDYLYETENGIYAEEQGVITKHNDNEEEGTHSKGFYQYTGDDGKLYRVEYTVGEQGFIPKLHLFQKQPNTL